MNKKWQEYCEKYLTITPREQYMVLATGLVAIVFIFHNFFIDENTTKISSLEKQIAQVAAKNRTNKNSIAVYQEGLSKNPNSALNEQISAYKKKLGKVDVNLLKLTSDLIDPIQMRHALLQLLKTQKGVTLQSFQVVPAEAITMSSPSTEPSEKSNNDKEVHNTGVEQAKSDLVLYRHAIKIKLSGGYFQLRDYLTQLEALSWKFFWQEFDYQLKEYPVSELEIEMYSLSTKQEFIGV